MICRDSCCQGYDTYDTLGVISGIFFLVQFSRKRSRKMQLLCPSVQLKGLPKKCMALWQIACHFRDFFLYYIKKERERDLVQIYRAFFDSLRGV